MSPLSSPVLAAAVLLILTGVPKIYRPGGTVVALRGLGVGKGSTAVARLIGVAECGIGVGALVVGGRWLNCAVAAAYAGFAIVLVLLLRRGVESCGCSSSEQTPPTISHLVLVIALAGAAAGAAFTEPVRGIATLGSPGVGLTIAVFALGAVAGWLAWAVVSLLPELVAQKAR